MTPTLGEIAFEAYHAAVHAAVQRGEPEPFRQITWGELGETAKAAWEQVGRSLTAQFIGPTRTCAIHIGSAKIALGELSPSRERSCVLTKLDEAEMWLERTDPVR